MSQRAALGGLRRERDRVSARARKKLQKQHDRAAEDYPACPRG